MDTSLSYTGNLLDRAGHLRKDADWIEIQLANPESIVIPFWRGKVGVHCYSDPAMDHKPLRITIKQLNDTPLTPEIVVFLGKERQTAIFAMDFSSMDENSFPFTTEETQLQDLRVAVHTLSHTEVAMLGYGKAVIHWHQQHQYCGKCGSTTMIKFAGHARQCSNASCELEGFPRTDPAVIMLVTRTCETTGNPLCLLGRNTNFPNNVYSTLAGYVDPGESLEEAVAREVEEEAGIKVSEVQYIASQPWPFPSQIMLGFTAKAITHHINIDPDEIADANWFTVEDIRNAGDWGDESATLCLPRRDSIAHFLVNHWLESYQ